MSEATARIKINRQLEAGGWRFFADGDLPPNVCLEVGVQLKNAFLDSLGVDFEKTRKGFIDFLLLDGRGFPFIVLEAKSESKHPLVGKEQARTYARSQNCRFVVLSNGNLHYFWDLERGNPYVITSFPTPESVTAYQRVTPDPRRLVEASVRDDYIALTQLPSYRSEAAWLNDAERPDFIRTNRLRFLRRYQIRAIRALQRAVRRGNDRFLFEMATGTGKTLTAAAVIKLFLSSGNASRVLFLVDRLELEDQAHRVLRELLSADFETVIYKHDREAWRRAEIVVTTVQSLLFNNKYQNLFSPTDFDLVISDEAHRSIGGNARAVFDFFVGYKLGLTATPRDYLRGTATTAHDPREFERRLLLDTYRTFGCESGQPTFRYSLLDGVRDGFLINPTVVDARTEVTTQLLSDEGYVISLVDDTGECQEEAYRLREFERRFFSEATNRLFCETLFSNALRDPISGEIGKTIIFAVSQAHAAKLTQILNEIADKAFPGKYRSDFAVQVTSQVRDAQSFTTMFSNNNLMGSGNFLASYRTSRARVCTTVGMMTTGYDCTDLLNLGLLRPVFSPTDFVQIKGRGTRRHNFREELLADAPTTGPVETEKTQFKLFDFFGNCEYFETEFRYDEVLELPPVGSSGRQPEVDSGASTGAFQYLGPDAVASIHHDTIGPEGMKVDRKLFETFQDTVRRDQVIADAVSAGRWDQVLDYVNRELFDKPEEYYTLEKLRQAAAVDRRLSLREILEKVLGFIPDFKSKEDLLQEEFAKFVADYKPEEATAIPAIRAYFRAYLTDADVRHIVDKREFTDLATNPVFSMREFRAVPARYRALVPEYVRDYVSLNQFAA